MNERRASVRVLSFLLALCMVLGMVPMQVFADDDLTTAEGSFAYTGTTEYIFVATDRHANTSILATMIDAMEAKIGENELDYLALGGDMVGSGDNHPTYKSSTVLSEITGATSSLSAANVDIVAGIHDMNVNDDAGIVLPYSGGGAQIYEGKNFYVYGVPESCISGAVSDVDPETEANDFVKWATNTDGDGVDIDTSKVIIVVSHYPLHVRRNDNVGATYWCDALNTVAVGNDTTIDRNVAFFWGHNHTSESSADTAVYHVAPNSTLSVQGTTKNSSVSKTIYFTYANAGYLNSHSSATLITITGSTITFDKYKESSVSTSNSVTRVGVPSTLSVTGQNTYSVGDTIVAPSKVEVAYSGVEESTDITEDGGYSLSAILDANGDEVTLTDNKFTAAGEYTLVYTCTLDGYTATAELTVEVSEPATPTEQTYYSEDKFGAITATAEGATVTSVEDDSKADALLDFWYGYNFALTEQVADTSTTVTLWLDPEAMSSSDLAVYYYNETTGAYEAVTGYTVDEDEYGVEYVTISNAALGTYVYGTPANVIPEGATLDSLTVVAPDKVDYFDTDAVYNEDLGAYVIYLDISGMSVTANYVLGDETYTDELSWNGFDSAADGYALTFENLAPGSYGEKTVTVSYGEKTSTFTIKVWGESFTTSDVTVKVGEDEYGVTELTVGESTNANVADAIEGLITGDSYVAYEIDLTFDTGYATKNSTKTVTLPIPEGVTNPVVYYVPTSGDAKYMTVTEKTDTTVTFTTTHFSTYVVGESAMTGTESSATVPGNQVTTYTPVAMTVYKLVTTPESGKTYLIVNSATGTGYGLDGDTAGYATTKFEGGDGYYSNYDEAAQSGTAFSVGSDVYLTTSGAYLWTAGSDSFTIGYNASSYGLGNITNTLDPDGTEGTWTLADNQLTINLQTYNGIGSSRDTYADFYLTNSGSTWGMDTSGAANVYFYEPVTIYTLSETTTGTQTATYGMYITYPDSDGNYVDTQQAITAQGVIPNETLQLGAVFTSSVDGQTPPSGGTWTITSSNTTVATVDNTGLVTFTGAAGETLIQATYTWVQDGVTYSVSNYVAITATAPDHYSIELHYADLTEVEADATFDSTATYYIFNSTTNVYEKVEITAFEDGVTYYTTPVVQGEEIDEVIALKGIEAGDRYPIWAVVKAYATSDDTEGVDVGELGDALSWDVSDTSIATIDTETGVLTFTGNNYGTFTVTVAYEGADGKVITDTITISATESLYVVPGDGTDDFPEYPNQGAVRFDKTATAVGNFSETGIAQVEISMTGVPYTTGSEIDVVLMLDQSTSMDDDRIAATVAATKAFIETIVKNEDGSFNGNRVYVGYFNGSTVTDITDSDNIGGDLASIDSQTELDALFEDIDEEFDGSPTTSGTEYAVALQKCYNRLNTAKTDGTGNNRQQFCVFMSDGVPTTYQYAESGMYGTSGDTQDGYTDMKGMFTGTNYDTRSSSYVYEYYSTQMKANGVIVYTVGLGLEAENNAWNGASATQCLNAASLLLNDISGPANEATQPDAVGTSTLSKKDTYFFSVEDEDAATELASVFTNIALSIKEAATNVVVEDKIGNDYSINFSLPGEVTSTETGGLTEFYIQVVEYQLDSNKERTGDPYVKENITFTTDSDGNLSVKSHTIDGTACGTTCSHVTITNNQVTAIDGTYFDYKRVTEYDSSGNAIDAEYLTWKEEKISTTELCLQYFAHLDDSSDAVGTDDEIPAGTYYTNEYATLTYTNYNGNQVQQEFPVPQMTWNGAQVSYVFYLVNDAGQPVNRAGRVVPFAEAVYVTDVYTYSIVWNSLEQSAGLEADYLAENIVPECYALYDDDAEYMIHVYEDEEEDNLNNHFTIGGDVTDDYNTTTHSWTNASTTYVFNNKSDGTKYTTVGTYINNDGTSTAVTTYLCKGEGEVSATIAQVTVADATAFAAGTYFVMNANGKYVQAAAFDANATYYAITSASYTAASGETQWTPGANDSTSGGTIFTDDDGNKFVYYIDENNKVYTIVQKSNGTEVETGFDFHNTTVAFAVVWKPELVEDVIVVDFGLDVVVDVIKNDSMAAGVVGVRTDAPSGVTMNSGEYNAAKATSVTVTSGNVDIGTVSVENLNSVRFSFDETNGMQFNQPISFYYEADVNFYDSDNELQTTSMYSQVTIIPATTVYYEDEYVVLKSFSKQDDGTYVEDETSTWTTAGTTTSATQDVDRPGESKISEAYDADNVYGYDSAYETMSTYSLGSAASINVTSSKRGEAYFTFYGTGFDVISMTDNTTGTLIIQVFAGSEASGTAVKSLIVDTYYGMEKDGTVSVNTPAAIYQVPVMKVSGLTYGQYTVKIIAAYNTYFDHNEAGNYTLYLDAIRIYDPTGVASGATTNTTVSNAYVADGEGWPNYQELRNNVIAASNYSVTENDDGTVTVNGSDLSGAIFIDCNDGTTSISDYVSYGPNNELYLAQNQAIAFNVNTYYQVSITAFETGVTYYTKNTDGTYQKVTGDYDEGTTYYLSQPVSDVQLGIKVGNGSSVTYTINGDTYTVSSTTDMYYSILKYAEAGTVVIKNTSGGILSLTNIKVTYTSKPVTTDSTSTASLLSMDAESVGYSLMMLRAVPSSDDTTEEETTEPETEEETTVPETEEETTESETTAPETEEETTESETTAPETEEETTEEETTQPETEPETEPEVQVFVPGKLDVKLSASAVKVGNSIIVTVTTGKDVEALTVNGQAITRYTENRWSGNRTWIVTVKAETVGSMTVDVVAYDAAGLASAPVTNTVTVTEKANNILEAIFGWLFR